MSALEDLVAGVLFDLSDGDPLTEGATIDLDEYDGIDKFLRTEVEIPDEGSIPAAPDDAYPNLIAEGDEIFDAPPEECSPSTKVHGDGAPRVRVARGDDLADLDALPSPLPGVSAAAWTQFARAMTTAGLGAVGAGNALGMFQITPRRLADMGLVEKLARVKSPKDGKKQIWVADFVAPLTAEMFLSSPKIQYAVFCGSMKDYARKIASGAIKVPAGESLSGALAVLHRAGPAGLASGQRFPATEALRDRAAGIF